MDPTPCSDQLSGLAWVLGHRARYPLQSFPYLLKAPKTISQRSKPPRRRLRPDAPVVDDIPTTLFRDTETYTDAPVPMRPVDDVIPMRRNRVTQPLLNTCRATHIKAEPAPIDFKRDPNTEYIPMQPVDGVIPMRRIRVTQPHVDSCPSTQVKGENPSSAPCIVKKERSVVATTDTPAPLSPAIPLVKRESADA